MKNIEYFDVLSKVSKNTQEYLSVLNEEQLEAVVHEGSPLLILAGAGSGKTRVITTKIAYLIAERHIEPWQILAVTFTKKAANEMRERAIRLEPRAAQSKILTFHSFGAWFLRTNSVAAGVIRNFTVYDEDDSTELVARSNPFLKKNRARYFAHLISLAKDYCRLPTDDLTSIQEGDEQFSEIYANYQNRLKETGNVDFGDLIMKPYLTLKENDEVRAYFRNRFKVILVDEYQDSNVAQYLLLQELSGVLDGSDNYVCVVGDDDQSIYRFRGAEIQNILNFPNEIPNTKIVRLEKNYRSTAEILRVADDVVKHNEHRLGKTLVAQRGSGEKPVLAFLRDGEEEAAEVVSLIKKTVRAGGSYSDWAVLYRINAQSLLFETAFIQSRVPYQVVGSLKFYEREEIKDAIAYLSLLANPRDEVAFRRIVNKPPRAIGSATQDRIADISRASVFSQIEEEKSDFIASVEKIAQSLSKKARSGAEHFAHLFRALSDFLNGEQSELEKLDWTGKHTKKTTQKQKGSPSLLFDFEESQKIEESSEEIEIEKKREDFFWTPTGKLSDVIWAIIQCSGLRQHFCEEDDVSGTSKFENLVELANSASPFEKSEAGLIAFLDHVELDRTQDDESADERVTLITLHNTKGLEFNNVVMTGMENSLFPRDDKSEDALEEERRLCYVGMTRARNRLFLTSCAQRRLFGHTVYGYRSRFLDEIGDGHVNVVCSVGQEGKKRRYLESKYGENGLSNPKFGDDSVLSAKFCLGTRLYHDDHGYGEIVKTSRSSSGEYKITVSFDNGELQTFLPKYNAHSLQIIKE